MQEALEHGFRDIIWSCFFGKLLKMALGHAYTHAQKAALDFEKVAHWCRSCGLEKFLTDQVKQANTGRHVLQIIECSPLGSEIIKHITRRSLDQARYFSGPRPDLSYYVFDFDGKLLCSLTEQGSNS